MTNELDAGRAIEILEDDEMEQENAAMGERMDAEREAFEAAYAELQGFEEKAYCLWFKKIGGEYEIAQVASAWWGWQKARSLPVGVPDGLFLGDALLMWNRRHDNPPIKVGYEYGVADALLQIMGAPTVKAEQVQCETCQDSGIVGHSDVCPECQDTWQPAPSLPAAGSAVDRVVATAPERIYLIIGDDCPRDADFSELGEVAWCEEEAAQGIEYVRAALSAQQSAPVCWVNDQQLLLCSKSPREVEPGNPMRDGLPRNIAGSALPTEYCNTPLYRGVQQSEPELVSVPSGGRGVLAMILKALDRDAEEGKAVRGEMAAELRALLASHAEGGKV